MSLAAAPPRRLEVRAPAKLNLFLEIQRRRPDGFHDLETLMVAIDLVDRLAFEDDPSGRITLVVDGDPSISAGPDNLVARAAHAIRAEAGVDRGARIELTKSIPAGAGLAGGSSDAWATLSALDRLWSLGLGPARLGRLAASLGSDVPFFGHAPAALCRGRGEIVEPLAPGRPLHFVLVCPPAPVSTAEVYRRLAVPRSPRPSGPILDAWSAGDVAGLGRELFNRLAPAAQALEPSLGRVAAALAGLVGGDLLGSLMSGSGSAHFGLARDRDAAEDAAKHLGGLGLGRALVVATSEFHAADAT